MTLFSALRATKVLVLSAALVAGGMTAADAGEARYERHRDHHRQRLAKIPRMEPGHHGGRLGTELRYSGSEPSRWRRNGDFYGGAVAAYRGDGYGTYVYVDDDGAADWYERPAKRRKGGPKIITVTPGQNGCSWEAGVCVIRPGF